MGTHQAVSPSPHFAPSFPFPLHHLLEDVESQIVQELIVEKWFVSVVKLDLCWHLVVQGDLILKLSYLLRGKFSVERDSFISNDDSADRVLVADLNCKGRQEIELFWSVGQVLDEGQLAKTVVEVNETSARVHGKHLQRIGHQLGCTIVGPFVTETCVLAI